MRLTDGIYLVASGASGVSLTHACDCNVYVVNSRPGLVLIDCGVGLEPQRIVDEMIADGLAPSALTHLLLTHYHLDHCGGARWFRDRFGLRVVASALTAQAVSSCDEEAISLAAAKRAGGYPADVHLAPCEVDIVMASGDVLSVGAVGIEALATPGHSRDMVSYFAHANGRTDLFSGDTLFFDGKVLLSAIHDCDPAALCRSLRSIAGKDFAGLFPGHQLWSARDGRRHAEKAMTFIDRLLLPPSL